MMDGTVVENKQIEKPELSSKDGLEEVPIATTNGSSESYGLPGKGDSTDSQPAPGPGKMIKSKRDLVILIVLCLVEFHGFFSFSMIAPFYPGEAKMKNVSIGVSGLVFAIHPLAVFILSPFVGKWIAKPSRTKPFILIGTICIAVGNIVFAFVTKFNNRYVFVVICFAARLIIAVGTALANTASLAFLTEMFKSHLSAVFGVTELFVGVGFMAGPSVGSVLYGNGKFWLPFIVVGGLNLINYGFIWFFIPKYEGPTNFTVNPDLSDGGVEGNRVERKITIRRSLKIPGVWMVCLTIHTIGLFLTFIQPIFAFHLKDVTHGKITIERIGLVFFLCPGIYACLAPVLGIYIDRWFNARNLIITGHFLVALSYIFMGPCPLFKSFAPKSLALTSVAYGFLGVAQCPIMVPVIADLQLAIVKAGYPSGLRTSSIVSGLFTSAINLGQVMGPFLGGVLYEYMSFPWASTIIAIFVFVEGVAMLVFTMWERKTVNICCLPAELIPDIGTNGHTNVSYDASGDEVAIEERENQANA